MTGFHFNGQKVNDKWETVWSKTFKCWVRIPKAK